MPGTLWTPGGRFCLHKTQRSLYSRGQPGESLVDIPSAQTQDQFTTGRRCQDLPLQRKRGNEEAEWAQLRRLRAGRRMASGRSAHTNHVMRLRSLQEPGDGLVGRGALSSCQEKRHSSASFSSSLRLEIYAKQKSLPSTLCMFGEEGKNLRLVSPERTWKNCQSKDKLCPSHLESQ